MAGVGFEILTFPAVWSAHRKGPAFKRNQEMVDAAQVVREAGTQVLCTAFLDLSRKPECPQRGGESSRHKRRGIFCMAPSSAALKHTKEPCNVPQGSSKTDGGCQQKEAIVYATRFD